MQPKQLPILLISLYELGHQPVGLKRAAGALRAAGFEPEMLDLAVEPWDADQVRRARLVALSVPMHTAMRLGMRAAERIREINPDCHLCFYGLYAVLNAGFLQEHLADSVIGAEFEEPLVFLARSLKGVRGSAFGVRVSGPSETRGAGSLQSLTTHSNPGGNTLSAPGTPRIPNTECRTPNAAGALHDLPSLGQYARLEVGGEYRLAGYVEATRGCKHLCRHCPIPAVYGGRFVVTPRETALEEIRSQVEAGAAHITFGDPDFLNGPSHALRIARAMHADLPHLTFDFTAKIEHLLKHRSLLPELRALGCLFIVSAVESVSDTVLERLRKGHTREDVVEALAAAREAGITLRPSLVPFTPWATLEDYLDLIEFVLEHELVDAVDPVQYSIRLLVPPGSLLLEEPSMQAHLGLLDPRAFSYEWAHPDPRMDRLHREVAALVEAAERNGEDPRETFARIGALAYTAAGRELLSPLPSLLSPQYRGPRLTESWFC